jgi:D-alanyl-D-alanine carboxypeptidase
MRSTSVRLACCLAVVLLTGFTTPIFAQADTGPTNSKGPALARLDSFASGLSKEDKFSGVVLVARNGHVLFEKAYGKRDAKGSDPNTLNTRFNLASAGKMFTSVAVWQQIAAGRLSLDTHVGDVLKDYPNRNFADTVTVRDLLTHTSGAGDVPLLGNENAANRAHVHSVADMVALESNQPPAFTPGSNLVYSNFGFVVLGRMVEVVSGEDYQTYVRRHIFEPAGMTRTVFIDCATPTPDLAVGYTTEDGKLVFNCETLRGFPAGGEASTAGDMYRFIRASNEDLSPIHGPWLFCDRLWPRCPRARLSLGARRQRRWRVHRCTHLSAYRGNHHHA